GCDAGAGCNLAIRGYVVLPVPQDNFLGLAGRSYNGELIFVLPGDVDIPESSDQEHDASVFEQQPVAAQRPTRRVPDRRIPEYQRRLAGQKSARHYSSDLRAQENCLAELEERRNRILPSCSQRRRRNRKVDFGCLLTGLEDREERHTAQAPLAGHPARRNSRSLDCVRCADSLRMTISFRTN